MKTHHRMTTLCCLGIILLCLSFPCTHAHGASFLRSLENTDTSAATEQHSSLPHIPLRVEFTQFDNTLWAALWLDIPQNYYIYAHASPSKETQQTHNVGIPTTVQVTDDTGAPLPMYYPPAITRRDFYEPDKIIRAYEGSVPFFVPLGSSANMAQEKTFDASISLLLCSQQHCVPLTIPHSLTTPNTMPVKSSELEAHLQLATPMPTNSDADPRDASSNTLHQAALANAQNIPLNTVSDTPATHNFTPQHFNAQLEVTNIATAILFGIIAGIILNLMPCVLPVLSLKASAFLVESTHNAAKHFREHMLFFALGILTQFALLALLLAGAGYMWGEFFQNTLFVATMLVIIFVLALSLLGVFTLPMVDLKAGTSTSPRVQAFVTGMVTTLLATPCSGPLLGGVLSWAFLQPLPVLVLIFMMVGCGMSAPYFLLACKPSWGTLLPKPGTWMHVLERIVAFFLLATALYLFSILPEHVYTLTLTGLLGLAFVGWLWGHFGGLTAPPMRRRLLGICFLCSMGLVPLLASPSIYMTDEVVLQPDAMWEKYQSQHFQSLLGKSPLLVEFTADWCPNCKFLEKTVLKEENRAQWHEAYGIRFIKVDITRNNHEGEALLRALGGKSIPFTALFPAGEHALKPVILRDIYTEETLIQALESLAQGASARSAE